MVIKSTVALKVKISLGKSVFIFIIYIEWNLPPEMHVNPSKCRPLSQLDRRSRIMDVTSAINPKDDPMLVLRD